MSKIYGIDLGTTNSSISVLMDGKPHMIPVDGNGIVPSVVSFDGKDILVGRKAGRAYRSGGKRFLFDVFYLRNHKGERKGCNHGKTSVDASLGGIQPQRTPGGIDYSSTTGQFHRLFLQAVFLYAA